MAQAPARRAAQAGPPPLPEPDSDSASRDAIRADNTRKRPRLGSGSGNGNGNGNGNGSDETPTAACDQCRVRKIRCDRRQPDCSNCIKAGFECNSTNTFKRVNPMKQLRDDFSDVLKHLRDVDKTLGTLTSLTREIAARPYPQATHPHLHTSSPPAYHALPTPSSGFDPVQPNSQYRPPSPNDHTDLLRDPLVETVEFDSGGERLYSYPAPLVLVKSLLRQVASALLDSNDKEGSSSNKEHLAPALREPIAQTVLRRKLDDFPFNSPCAESVASGDNNPVTTPPRLMVNLLGDGYLRNINVRTPIFDDDELRRGIDAHYADDRPQQSSAWALIVNNIVLLELGLEIQTARASHSHSRGMNDDIIPSFLKNCHRAIGNLSAFMTPSLVNVQALMTLTLVAREFYNSATAEKVCYAACQVGRAMGLHRSASACQDEKNNDAERVRHRLFRVLYAMDKQRVFMTGQPCDLHMFDSDHHIGSSRSHQEGNSPISDAYDDIMILWEEIYLNLYTSRAAVASLETRARQVRLVSNSTHKFARTHSALIAMPSFADGIADTDLMLVELAYVYRVSQVLVLRCDRDDEQGLEKMREFARSSLKMILEVGRGPLTTYRLAFLASIFRRYPMVAFIELVAFRLAHLFSNGDYDSATQADVALLRGVCDQLRSLQHGNLPLSFYARLKMGLVWAVETLESMGEALMGLSPRSQPAGFSPHHTESSCSTESLSQKPANGVNSMLPDILSACNFQHVRSNQDVSRLPSSRRTDEVLGHGGLAEMTSFGFMTPDMDRMDMTSGPLPTGQFGTSSSSAPQPQPRLESTSGSIANNPNWNDFNLDFFQASLV
ncbi:hypothetical protein GGR51DRAFT_201377 [Nemania sp. FL0031]|nr:hypothetical protein GGR51DRAFT_201377 [Nemania sp. FL0031]